MAWSEQDDGKGVVLVYATCPDKASALKIAEQCVSAQLAACVNILDNVTSVFVWNGKTETGTEVSLIAKSTATCASALTDLIVRLHPYDVPAVSVVPVVAGHAPFLDWVHQSVEVPSNQTATPTKNPEPKS